jgi:cob(I)alamin adenosyltransferase
MTQSITTKRGDAGETDLLFGGRVGKSHPRLHAVGEVDELNAALGLVRVQVRNAGLRAIAARAQQDLVALMGILSAGPEHAERYETQGFKGLGPESVERLTLEAKALETEFPDGFHGWSMPGDKGGAGAAWLEMARCICRRAERAVIALPPEDAPLNPHVVPWLNRLSDLLWLAARVEEKLGEA